MHGAISVNVAHVNNMPRAKIKQWNFKRMSNKAYFVETSHCLLSNYRTSTTN